MPKLKVKTVVVKCECSKCGQVSNVVPGKMHAVCSGLMPEFKAKIGNLNLKGSPGIWETHWLAGVNMAPIG